MALRSLPLVAVLVLSIAPAAAAQQRCEAPPGTAAIDQYCETVPTAGGERDAGDDERSRSGAAGGGGGNATPPSAAPSGETLSELRREGEDGRALADSLRGAEQGGKRSEDRPSVSAAADSRVEPEASESPVDAVKSALDDGPTLGTALPWALLGVALVMAGVLWLRFRAQRPDTLDS